MNREELLKKLNERKDAELDLSQDWLLVLVGTVVFISGAISIISIFLITRPWFWLMIIAICVISYTT